MWCLHMIDRGVNPELVDVTTSTCAPPVPMANAQAASAHGLHIPNNHSRMKTACTQLVSSPADTAARSCGAIRRLLAFPQFDRFYSAAWAWPDYG